MRTYGTATLQDGEWHIKCEPHVMIRLKRVFGRKSGKQFGTIKLAANLETARDLEWFCERFPLKIEPAEHLTRCADEHRRRADEIARLLSGELKARDFEMAIPPREYQRVGAEMALRIGSLLIGDDIGTGKTATAICALTEAWTRPAVVVTLTHLPRQWEMELKRFAPSLRVHVVTKGKPYDLTRRDRGRQLGLPGAFPDVIVLNYHKLPGWAEVLAPRAASVVFDEIQELRRARDREGYTAKYAAAKHLAENASLRIGLSGTPIYNYGDEIFNVLEILRPGALGTQAEFHAEWCVWAGSDKRMIEKPKAFGTYVREHGLMLRRTRADVGRELPPLTRVSHHIDADIRELDKVKDVAGELARLILSTNKQVDGDKWKASERLNDLMRQATGIAKAPYVAEFVKLLVESGEKVVLFGWHREVYAIWLSRLAELKPVMYTGSESPAQKHEARRKFISGESSVLIMSLRSGAGLDGLQGSCRTAVFGELDWSPGVHEQCIGRVHRDGQGDPVVAYFLVADSGSDPTIADVLQMKTGQIEGIRDPDAELVEKLQAGGMDRVRRLAESVLAQRAARIANPMRAEPMRANG